jgi:hypothetical protein
MYQHDGLNLEMHTPIELFAFIKNLFTVIMMLLITVHHIVRPNQDLLHFGTKSIADMYEKSIKIAKLSAKDLYKRNTKPKNPFISGIWFFCGSIYLNLDF